MNFLDPLFIVLGPCGLIFLIAGYILLKFPPKKINALYGYRTPNSMKNMERWTFAQTYSARLMIRLGLLYTFLAIPALFISFRDGVAMFIGLGLLILGAVLLLVLTEKAINQRFG